MIRQSTQTIYTSGGLKEYTINFTTDIARYYEQVENVVRKCIDEHSNINNSNTVPQDDYYVVPYVSVSQDPMGGGSTRLDYLCSDCDRSIITESKRYYVYCPHCGKKIDYTSYEFLRTGKTP